MSLSCPFRRKAENCIHQQCEDIASVVQVCVRNSCNTYYMILGKERVSIYGLGRQYLKHVLLLRNLLHPPGVQKRGVLLLGFCQLGLLMCLSCSY